MNHFPIEERIGSLMTYEMTYIEYENYLPKNMKDLALRTQEGYLCKSSSDDDIELLTSKFIKFI